MPLVKAETWEDACQQSEAASSPNDIQQRMNRTTSRTQPQTSAGFQLGKTSMIWHLVAPQIWEASLELKPKYVWV